MKAALHGAAKGSRKRRARVSCRHEKTADDFVPDGRARRDLNAQKGIPGANGPIVLRCLKFYTMAHMFAAGY